MNFKNIKLNILITGASGMLGSTLAFNLKDKFNVFGTGNSDFINAKFNYLKFDLLSDDFNELIKWSQPDLIIHCAALTDVDYCQSNPWEALNVNAYSVKKLINATQDFVKFIFISTDAVFPFKLHMAKENDFRSPENIYGKSKELGEYFLLNSNREYLILRTTIVGLNTYNFKKSFVEWILNSVRAKKTISLFDDVFFTPISIWDFISEIRFLIDNDFVDSKVLHISGSEVITKYDFGFNLIKNISLNTKYLRKGKLDDVDLIAKRSNDQTLDSSYYQRKFERKLPKLKDTINSLIENY